MSLYRKWRPQTFAEVTGQEHVVRTLGNALTQGRLAHAYLFSGPRGTGKTTVARLLAKSLNCAEGPQVQACNTCEACRRITQGTSMDVTEIDGASNRGIDEIRDVRENIRFAPAEGRYRVYIIDEIHMLTAEAFNALLKVLEEPPAHGVFIFATTEPHKVPATVLSRCQRFDFRPLFAEEIRDRLDMICREEGIAWEEPALDLIARHAEGGLRDALSILDQCVAFAEGALTPAAVEQVVGSAPREWIHRLASLIGRRDAAGEAFRLVQDLRARGKDLRQFVRDAARHLRDLMVVSSASDARGLVDVPTEERHLMVQQAKQLGMERILAALDVLLRAEADMRWAPNPQLLLEVALLRLGRLDALGMSAVPATSSDGARPVPTAGPVAPIRETVVPTRETMVVGRETMAPAEEAVAPAREMIHVNAPPAPRKVQRPEAPGRSASPIPPGAGPFTLSEVIDAWPRVLHRLREERQPQTHAFLVEGRPVAVQTDGTVVVEFPPDRRFHRDSFERGKHRNHVEKALRDVLGHGTRVVTQVSGEGSVPADASLRSGDAITPLTGEERPAASFPPAVEATLDVFGGRVIAVERTGDES